MADFYDDMKAMAAELLASTSEGGLGQGAIELVRTVTEPPANSWEIGEAMEQVTPLKGVAFGVSTALIDGSAIMAGDLECTCAAEGLESYAFAAGDVIRLDGKPRTVIRALRIPEAGTLVAMSFILR